MTRRARAHLVLGLALMASAACSYGKQSPETTSPPAEKAQPNIVVIMTDDQTLEQMRVLTKTQELIGDHGVSFERYFASFPLCCPARATFLTGQYSHNHGVRANVPPHGGYAALTREEKTIPVALQDAGYRTMLVGKYLNGYGEDDPTRVPPGWDRWHGGVDPSTYNYVNFRMNHNGTVQSYEGEESYTTDVATGIATQEITAAAADDVPFFLWLSYLAPHNAYAENTSFETRVGADGKTRAATVPAPVPARRHAGTFADETAPRTPSFDEPDDADKPPWIRNRPALDPGDIAGIDASYRAELESLLAVDEGVEDVMAALTDAGVLANTYVVFTSDNGYFHGEHGIPFGKLLPYEESIRVPLLVRGPGVVQGATTTAMRSDVDLPATIIDLAGAKALRVLDGQTLRPVLLRPGATDGVDRPILLEAGPVGPLTPPYSGVRTDQYTYIEYNGGTVELYDLDADPLQLTNLAGNPRVAAVEAELATLTKRLADCKGATCW